MYCKKDTCGLKIVKRKPLRRENETYLLHRNCNNLCKYNGYKKDGSRKFYKLCSSCCKRKYNDKWIPKKNPSHRCQLDVDHINGDKKDNRESNLQTLCANCHRLKTLVNEDWK